MIPAYGLSGHLPPFIGKDATDRAGASPYQATMSEVVNRLATSNERVAIATGLLDYRVALAAIGISQGFQWIGGSYVEDCEAIRQRPPADVDIVTFAYRPTSASSPPDWSRLITDNLALFDPALVKSTYKCDAYFVDMSKLSYLIVQDTAYWHGLFSHQRGTSQWKGMLAVQLTCDDANARNIMTGII